MALIVDLEAQVTDVNAVLGIAYLSGIHKEMAAPFNTDDRTRAYTEVINGLTGIETVLRFHFEPAEEGLRKVDDMVYLNSPTPRVSEKWRELRPALYDRLAFVNGANGNGRH